MNTEIQTKIAAKIAQYPSKRNHEIAKLFKINGVGSKEVATVRAAMPPSDAVNVRVRSISEFKRAHDIPQKIRNQISSLKGGGYVTEEELRQICEVPVQNWRRNAELPEFSVNKFKLEGVTYWAGAETIKQMKQITGRA